MPKIKKPIYLLFPSLLEAADSLLVRDRRVVTLEELGKFLKRRSSVGNQRQPSVLRRIELRYVDIDELDVWILKSRLRSGGEVRVARTNSDNQVGVAG
jgi:hypothetical protein